MDEFDVSVRFKSTIHIDKDDSVYKSQYSPMLESTEYEGIETKMALKQ